MCKLADVTWTRLMDRGGATITGMRLHSCTFNNCGISLTSNTKTISHVSSVELIQCASLGSVVGPCCLEDILVDGLKTTDLLIVWGALFKHVTLRGRIGRIKINRSIHDPYKTPEMQVAFDIFRERFYAECDWALDIASAELQELTVEAIPCRLIRRDPESQIVVDRARIQSLEQLTLLRRDFPDLEFTLRRFFSRSLDPEMLLVAPKAASPKVRMHAQSGLQAVRELGMAWPD